MNRLSLLSVGTSVVLSLGALGSNALASAEPESALFELAGMPDVAFGTGYLRAKGEGNLGRLGQFTADVCVGGVVENPSALSNPSLVVGSTMIRIDDAGELTKKLPHGMPNLLGSELGDFESWADTGNPNNRVTLTWVEAQGPSFNLDDTHWAAQPGANCGNAYVNTKTVKMAVVSIIKMSFQSRDDERAFTMLFGHNEPFGVTLGGGEPGKLDEMIDFLDQHSVTVSSRQFHLGGDRAALEAAVGDGICNTTDLRQCLQRNQAFIAAFEAGMQTVPTSLDDLGDWRVGSFAVITNFMPGNPAFMDGVGPRPLAVQAALL